MSNSTNTNRSAGFTLVESLMALIMVSVVIMLLAPALFHVANERVTIDAASRREAILLGESNRLASLPFADLDAQAGCANVATPHLPHQRCITMTSPSAQERRLVLKVIPNSMLVPRDSVVITRTDRKPNPFDTRQP